MGDHAANGHLYSATTNWGAEKQFYGMEERRDEIAQLGVNFYVSIVHFHAAFFLVRVNFSMRAARMLSTRYLFL